jgi:hypothetical protein
MLWLSFVGHSVELREAQYLKGCADVPYSRVRIAYNPLQIKLRSLVE